MTVSKKMENHEEEDESAGCSHGGDTERPLKKARYVWQVKGSKGQARAPDDQCGGSCIETFIARTESILESSDEDDEDRSRSRTGSSTHIERSISDEIPVTLVAKNDGDHQLRKWQARQMARAYIDNTINGVLESRAFVPFDADDLVEKCQQNGLVEDEAILMAIQAHGLQADQSQAVVVVETEQKTAQAEQGKEADILSGILNLAVLAAIEKKGLSQCGVE